MQEMQRAVQSINELLFKLSDNDPILLNFESQTFLHVLPEPLAGVITFMQYIQLACHTSHAALHLHTKQ